MGMSGVGGGGRDVTYGHLFHHVLLLVELLFESALLSLEDRDALVVLSAVAVARRFGPATAYRRRAEPRRSFHRCRHEHWEQGLGQQHEDGFPTAGDGIVWVDQKRSVEVVVGCGERRVDVLFGPLEEGKGG